VIFKTGEVQPGRYRLLCEINGTASEMRSVQIQPGETTRSEWTVRTGAFRQIEFHITDGEARARRLHVAIRREGGDVVVDRECFLDNPQRGEPTYTLIAGFAAGRYAFEASSRERLGVKGSFDVADLNPSYEPIKVDLVRER
jgi:hypothetical protein